MKPFRFTLQPIRVIREQKEQKAQKVFGDALRLCDDAAFQLKVASDELVAAWSALCHDMSTGVNAAQLARTRAWCNVLELRQKERAEALQHARRAMDAALKSMHLATRDREAIDHYHDKRRTAYNVEVQREEQKNLDELGLRRTGFSIGFGRRNQTKSL
ncbi:MAG TPA: flagellar export protein FliJ [Candidatus Paceibacterota bacterium]|nr:flagellar export protein FliJ [Candidatus Paceibacterota bacterium]